MPGHDHFFRPITRRGLRWWRNAAAALFAALAFSLPAYAGQAALAWDASTDPSVTGYYVYYGTSSYSYAPKLDAGNQTTFTVPGLTNGQTYYFAVTAYNALRAESAYSNEVSTTIPSSPPAVTTIASSSNPVVFGAAVTFTATVTGTAPTGNVTFKDGGATIGGCSAAALVGSGNTRTATCTTSSLAAGTRSIVATYNGDANNGASTSSTLSQVVNKVATTTTVASSANPSNAGASVTFTATVTGISPTGTVNFKDASTSISGCSAATVSGSGNTRTATCTTSTLSVGTHSITAAYSGDAGNLASTSSTLSQVVSSKATTTTGIASSANPSTTGASITLTATVTGVSPTGTVNFKDGSSSIGGCSANTLSGSGNSRTATCSTSSLSAGTHSITAAYGGDAGNLASTSSVLSQVVVTKSATTTTVASSRNPSTLGTLVTLTATVTGNAPTGNVNFVDGGTSIAGCSAAIVSGTGNSRTAVCNTTKLVMGGHSIVAVYAGDAINISSSSAALTQTVTATATGPATLQTAASRKVHGASGTFDVPLSLVASSPTIEPRQGPAATVVFTFNKPVNSASVAVTEGSATAGTPTFVGNDVVVGLTNVTDRQYVTISVTNAHSVDGYSGGSGAVRIGFLLGDVNQNGVVTVSDVAIVSGQLAQPVTAATFLYDVNFSGTLSVSDKSLTNDTQSNSLPAP